MQTSEQAPVTSSGRGTAALYEWMDTIIGALIVVALIFAFIARTVGVDGHSMETTLHHGERLILTRLYTEPQRGDIVVVNQDGEEPLIKRVVAVGGDTVDIHDGHFYLNDVLQSEDYIHVSTPEEEFRGPLTVPEGTVFVMGDNRVNSHDSRYTDIGCVDVRRLAGKVMWRIGPLNRAGSVYP